MNKSLTAFLVILVLFSTAIARRLWEPTDVQPIYSLRSATALEITDRYFYIALSNGILRFYRFEDNIDFTEFVSFPVPGEILRIQELSDSIFVRTTEGIFARREMDILDIPFVPIDSTRRLPPALDLCNPYNFGISLPYSFFWETKDTIIGPDMTRYFVTDCVSDGSYYIYFATDGLGVFRADRRIKIAEPLFYGPCCDDINAIYAIGDTLLFGGCSDIVYCAFSIYDTNNSLYKWIPGEYSVAFPDFGPILDFALHGEDLYIATPFGLGLYDLAKNIWRRPTGRGSVPISNANAIIIHNDTLYVASNDGIYSMDLNNRILARRTDAGVSNIVDIAYAINNIIAVGDYGAYSKEDTTFAPLRPPDGHLDNFVYSVTAGPKSEAVFATRHGIVILHESGKREFYSTGIYFEGARINDIAVSHKYLWVATDTGLFVFDRIYRKSTKLDEELFFPETPVYKLLIHEDYLWFATDIGLYRFFWNETGRIYR